MAAASSVVKPYESTFVVEYARSNRSKCRGCFKSIEQEKLRVGEKNTLCYGPFAIQWYHFSCFESYAMDFVLGLSGDLTVSKFDGFNGLKKKDQIKVKQTIRLVKRFTCKKEIERDSDDENKDDGETTDEDSSDDIDDTSSDDFDDILSSD